MSARVCYLSVHNKGPGCVAIAGIVQAGPCCVRSMTNPPFDQLSRLDGVERLVHEPSRMAILTILSACVEADFTFLQRATGLTQGNLSLHLSKLADAALITIAKDFVGKRPRTRAVITEHGRNAIEAHWDRLARIRQAARNWRPQES
jgi:DNA-binding transcriptional ArsR family regulator